MTMQTESAPLITTPAAPEDLDARDEHDLVLALERARAADATARQQLDLLARGDRNMRASLEASRATLASLGLPAEPGAEPSKLERSIAEDAHRLELLAPHLATAEAEARAASATLAAAERALEARHAAAHPALAGAARRAHVAAVEANDAAERARAELQRARTTVAVAERAYAESDDARAWQRVEDAAAAQTQAEIRARHAEARASEASRAHDAARAALAAAVQAAAVQAAALATFRAAIAPDVARHVALVRELAAVGARLDAATARQQRRAARAGTAALPDDAGRYLARRAVALWRERERDAPAADASAARASDAVLQLGAEDLAMLADAAAPAARDDSAPRAPLAESTDRS